MSSGKKVLCVTANPCVDKVMWFQGDQERPSRTFRQLGGKGVNVARMMGWLGHTVVSLTFGGGRERLLADRDPCRTVLVPAAQGIREIPLRIYPDRGETRLEYHNTNQVSPEEAEAFLSAYRRELAAGPELVAISGSACAGAEGTIPVMVRLAKEQGLPVILDSYGQCFLDSLPEGPDYVKPNREELEQAVGTVPPGEESDAARALIARGAGCVLLTLGDQGAWCVTREEAIFQPVFPVPVVSAVGCGDTFTAYFAHGLLAGWPLGRCFATGSAAGAANAMRSISGRTRKNQVDQVLRRAGLTTIDTR